MIHGLFMIGPVVIGYRSDDGKNFIVRTTIGDKAVETNMTAKDLRKYIATHVKVALENRKKPKRSA